MINTKEKYGLDLIHAIALFVVLVLDFLSFVCNLIMNRGLITVQICLSLIIFVAVAFYGSYGYKKPHGNHMRYLLLTYAISTAGMVVVSGKIQPTYLTVNYLVVIILTTYMAGRLDRFKQNLIISAIVLVCCFVSFVSLIKVLPLLRIPVNFVNVMACFGTVTSWFSIASAYLTRYRLHKEAAFDDKK